MVTRAQHVALTKRRRELQHSLATRCHLRTYWARLTFYELASRGGPMRHPQGYGFADDQPTHRRVLTP
jgi:hypothetical protein